jgi:prepilin-type N-terminal cleavage/methylation domain-containing protein
MKKSFTLIETLVAISILGIGILGISTLIFSQIALTHYSENKLIAAYLAQEGIEIVRNVRDTNWLNHRNWDAEITFNTTTTQLDYTTSSTIPDLSLSSCNRLKFDGNFYNCSSGNDTPFKREVFISKSGDKMTIKVIVSWQEKGKTMQYSVTGKLYNWR